MKANIVDINNKNVSEIDLSDYVFGIKPNKEVIAQYLRVYLTNQRQGTVSTKTRSEVRGGGKKPWKQKGTGRARHGSIRSPIWVGGGVAHGPQQRPWTLALPKKVRRLAIRSVLSSALSKKSINIVEKLEPKTNKTKEVSKYLGGLLKSRKNLIIWKDRNENLLQGGINIPEVSFACVENLNAYEVLNSDNIIITQSAIEFLQEKYNETK